MSWPSWEGWVMSTPHELSGVQCVFVDDAHERFTAASLLGRLDGVSSPHTPPTQPPDPRVKQPEETGTTDVEVSNDRPPPHGTTRPRLAFSVSKVHLAIYLEIGLSFICSILLAWSPFR